MKNNYNKTKIIFYFIFLLFISDVKSQEFFFESEFIETKENQIIIATGDVIAQSENKILKSDKLELNKTTKIHVLTGNVFFKDKHNNEIFSQKITYDEFNNKYQSLGNTLVRINNSIKLITKDLVYNGDDKILVNDENSTLEDDLGNLIFFDNFLYDVKNGIIKAYKVKIVDKEDNIYNLGILYYDLIQKKIFGKDIHINKDNKKLLEKKHLARSKSRSLVNDESYTILKNSVYTNCKKRDGCPPWLINADKITHDKKEKTIYYENATLKFYDIPIFYFPKFFHPDPTVKRKSGFLTPTINSKKNMGYLNTPYFLAISESSDLTFSPRFYDNYDILYQGEYRKELENSSHILDASIKSSNIIPLTNNSEYNHFFLKSNINTNYDYFSTSNFNLRIERVSNDKYLKTYDLKSPIINSQSTLLSSLNFNGFNEDLDFSISAEVYKDLTKSKSSDQYEFIFPNYDLTKNLYNNSNGILEFQSSGFIKNYDTNIYEEKVINNIIYSSSKNYSEKGLITDYSLNLKNVNTNSKNSSVNKNKLENNLQGIFQYNLGYPLEKIENNYKKIFKPLLSFKYNPLKNKNITTNQNLVNYSNIFSLNRLASDEVLEGGRSITLGNEYKIFSKKDLNKSIFELNLASSFRDKENSDLPKKSSLGQKMSNIFGNSKLELNNFVGIEYDFITKNNLKDFNYHNLTSKFTVNNFVTKFEFIEENNELGNESFIANESALKIDENKSLLFRVRENKKTNIKEYYDLVYQYKMDCLTAGVKYRKSYYNDGTLRPEESLNFSITFMPFDNTVNMPNIF